MPRALRTAAGTVVCPFAVTVLSSRTKSGIIEPALSIGHAIGTKSKEISLLDQAETKKGAALFGPSPSPNRWSLPGSEVHVAHATHAARRAAGRSLLLRPLGHHR